MNNRKGSVYCSMSQIKGIIFDKDGTLIEFDALFGQIAKQLVEQFITEFSLPTDRVLREELSQVIGLQGDKVDPKGIVAAGTTQDITEAFAKLLQGKNMMPDTLENMYTWISERLFVLTKSDVAEIKPTANLRELLDQLQHRGIKIGVVTADDWESTNFCLEKLGVKHYFDFIGTSDQYVKKPDPFMLHIFCEKYQLNPQEVAMVGDTVIDLQFARNGEAGLAIGVLSGVSGPDELEELADIILPSVGEIIEVVDNRKK